ncbi:uncharacterized protein Z520_02197 [Fonsecaea multimorphosa CBS 102226]|uniref:NmrA-like domain-containing protein n=1 Tax=Fonsecaea multimorphosa CBS 102226 TaxID=1442371 RepID=A0A0D2KZ13_9EURO|nr:uncharacterized protein Z520_02197 [Fonsecaea multimorphosa CBS 102226]KIY02059.1 hypothetical protein Z520_02197 [Fonsecaea multimorphosa CBS 102226]
MPKLILVTGATGNQGENWCLCGSVAKLLLQYPEQYTVRCLTRNTESKAARELGDSGAELVRGNLTDLSTLPAAVIGCWGVFAVTNFYDAAIIDDPMSEEQQGRNLAKAAHDAGTVECFIWSTMPSSHALSGGKFFTRLYEGNAEVRLAPVQLFTDSGSSGKHLVDGYIRELGLHGTFLYTGNFYENMVLRKHMSYDKETDTIIFKQPIIAPDAELTMLYVEKDLSAIVKAIFDQWEEKKAELDGAYLQASNARVRPKDIVAAAKKVSGKNVEYVVLPTTGVPERDTMFQFYNDVGMHPGVSLPDPQVVKLGVQLHDAEDYIREKLLPHLGLVPVN